MHGSCMLLRFITFLIFAVILSLSSCSLFISSDSSRYEGNFYGLIVGVDEYGGRSDLGGEPVKDANAVNKIFNNHGYHNTLLIDENATRENIINELHNFKNTLHEDDTLLFYFAGHGGLEDIEEKYIITTEQDIITTSDLYNALSDIPSKKIVILDSCFSGGFVSEINKATTDVDIIPEAYDENKTITVIPDHLYLSIKKYFSGNENASNTDIWVISSGGREEEVPEESLFVKGLIKADEKDEKGYYKYDLNNDSFVTLTELYDSVYNYMIGNYPTSLPHLTGGPKDVVVFSTQEL